MYLKIALSAIIVPIIFAIQTALINGLPEAFHFNLILVFIIVVLLTLGRDEALWFSIGFGFLHDLYFVDYFGANIIILTSMVFFASLLLARFFTNKSAYSFLALALFGSIFYDLFFYIINFVYTRMLSGKQAGISFEINFEIMRIFLNLIATLILFYIINYFSNRMKPVFLIKKQKI
jgi:rod shape-determining protein MreD